MPFENADVAEWAIASIMGEDELAPEQKSELENLRRELFRNPRGPRAELT